LRPCFQKQLIAPCPERDRISLELLYGCGLRVAELCGLNLDDFRDEEVILVRGKGKKERLVILGEYAQASIQLGCRRGRNGWRN
jgi:integrase/recombinase XerC